jgi:hypothetical protein
MRRRPLAVHTNPAVSRAGLPGCLPLKPQRVRLPAGDADTSNERLVVDVEGRGGEAVVVVDCEGDNRVLVGRCQGVEYLPGGDPLDDALFVGGSHWREPELHEP